MTDDEDFDDLAPEHGAIGVGMGGSCPVCRAPVDLGQEFCLECGSPIRFTPRQRRQQRRPADGARSAPIAPPKSGFPWVPFLIVLAVIGAGVAFALVDGGGDDDGRSSSATTEEALPSIDNTQPETTTSDTETTTVDDCAQAGSVLDDTQPALGVPDSEVAPGDPSLGGEEIPELSDGISPGPGAETDPFEDPSVPSTGADPGSDGTVTVDRDGNLCGGDAGSPADPSGQDPSGIPGGLDDIDAGTDPGSSPEPTESGDWPAGEEGWTVIVAGYDTDARAAQRAADVQADGFSDGGVLFSSDFTSLCPGFHVVFSGVFDRRSEAEQRLTELKAKDYAGMYVREIKRSGSAPTTC